MGRYIVFGARRNDGIEVRRSFDAPSKEAAERSAYVQGILVFSTVEEPDSPPSVDDLASVAADEKVSFQSAVRARKPRKGPPAILPSYADLRLVSRTLLVLAIVGYVLGLIVLFEGVAVVLNSSVDEAGSKSISVFVIAFATIAISGVLHGLSAICTAVRDIAQNSFR